MAFAGNFIMFMRQEKGNSVKFHWPFPARDGSCRKRDSLFGSSTSDLLPSLDFSVGQHVADLQIVKKTRVELDDLF